MSSISRQQFDSVTRQRFTVYAKVREDGRWYRVINVVGPHAAVYILDVKGRVHKEDIEKLEFD